MYRYLIISIIFIACAYIGYYIGETYKGRSLQLRELQKALILMNSEILYSNTPLPIALYNVSNKLSGPFAIIFSDISTKLKNGEVFSVYEGYIQSYTSIKDEFNLKSEDLNIIKDFFLTLGESSLYGQEKILNLTLENLKVNCVEAENESKLNTKMFRTLGLCIGAILAIFLI